MGWHFSSCVLFIFSCLFHCLTAALSFDRGCAIWKVERFCPVHAQSQVSLNQESCRLLLHTRAMMIRLSCSHDWNDRFTWGHDFDQKLAELRQEFPRYSAPGLDRDIAQTLEKHLFTHEGEEWIDERFQAIVRKDDIVSQNQKVKGKEFVCLKNGTNSFNIYESIDPDPHFTSGLCVLITGESLHLQCTCPN